jgi:tetratricopeptide (TPR) repeat protein
MKVSQEKHKQWVYVVLVLMILALLGFSTLPVVGSVFQASQSPTNDSPKGSISQEEEKRLTALAEGYQLVLQREPDNQIALRGLLDAKLQQGDLQGAIAPLERLAQLNPETIDYQILVAQTKQQLKNYPGARETYGKILTIHPDNLKALQGMVNLLLEQKLPEEAINLVKNTLQSNQINPQDTLSLQLLLGQIYALSERNQEAIAIYDQIIEAHPEDFRPLLSKAILFKQEGKLEEAKPLFDAAFDKAPSVYREQIRAVAKS